MRLELARSAGFCYGVRRAVQMAEMAAEGGRPCVMLGPIIHNRDVIAYLESIGVGLVDTPEEVPPGTAVLIRSHGEGRPVHEALARLGRPVIDATCPNVSRIHQIVSRAEEGGRQVLIIGTRTHPEVAAIAGWCRRPVVREGAEEPGYAAYAAALAARREPVAAPRVVYQGEPGCYSEEAAVGFFGPEVSSRGLAWFPDVFAALERGEADYAVLPVENSSTGSIRQVYDLLAQYNYYVVGECQVKVEHCLMALPGVALEDIHTVYSHEQGLMQCERYLDAHRGWRRVPTLDTAGSAKQVAESGDRTAAAICSRRAAQIYGLHILAEGVNYNAMNHTRFVVVSPVLELRPGRNKISTVFRLPHQSGSLHEILTVFAVQGLNLLKIESRPIPGRGWEYLFFLDFTSDLAAPEMDGVLHELGQLAAEFRILGNFRGYEP